MKTNTRALILEYIRSRGRTRPNDLIEHFSLSAVIVHRHLKTLLLAGEIRKTGSPPLVFYEAKNNTPSSHKPPQNESWKPNSTEMDFLASHYLYFTPSGECLLGFEGFKEWTKSVGEEKRIQALVREYINITREYDEYRKENFIDATTRFQSIFKNMTLDRVYYSDFYSLPKFGKTRLGSLVLHGKQAQSKKIIKKIALECEPTIQNLIKKLKIDAVAWEPHSLPRKIPFLKELEKNMSLSAHKIQLVKAYSGEIPIAQKSLSKLEERIRNAAETIFVKNSELGAKRILIIDDAIGSGATLEETAKKLKSMGADFVAGYAVVGSLKGFEVIREV